MREVYIQWKTLTDSMYAGLSSADEATESIIGILRENGIETRVNGHTLLAKSYFVYDKGMYSEEDIEKPLGLGLIYSKPDGTRTQDIFIISPQGELNKYYSEREMIKKYPAMEGVHKNNLPI